jgi:hypothetical protein
MTALRVVVDVEPDLSAGMSPEQVARLARGIVCVQCSGGVQVDVSSLAAVIFDRPCIAALRLHQLADTATAMSLDCGGLTTATGRWWHDRAALLKVVAALLIRNREWLWAHVREREAA